MRRAIVAPAILAGAALDQLKQWLAITTAGEDVLLTALLRAALELCEAFTGQMPLETLCEEILPSCAGWQQIHTRPVQAISGVEAIRPDGARSPLAVGDYAIDLDSDGCGSVRVDRPVSGGRIAVRFTAGLTADWTSLPDGLRHGVLRLAAHQYRERDGDSPQPSPPAAVAALWRPWRRLRLA